MLYHLFIKYFLDFSTLFSAPTFLPTPITTLISAPELHNDYPLPPHHPITYLVSFSHLWPWSMKASFFFFWFLGPTVCWSLLWALRSGSHAKNKQIIATKLESMDGKNWEFIFLFSIWNFVVLYLPHILIDSHVWFFSMNKNYDKRNKSVLINWGLIDQKMFKT